LLKKIPFRITVLSLFLFLALLIIVFMIYMQTNYGKNFSQKIMNTNFKLISSNIEENLESLDTINGFFVDTISSTFVNLDNIEEIKQDKQKYLKILTDILQKNKELYATYFAFEDNSFFEIINLNIDNNLRKQYNLSNSSRWLLVLIDGKNKTQRELYIYDEKLNLLKTQTKTNDYLATTRPWYIKASEQKELLIKSKPYSFKHIDATGMTYAKRYNPKVTFALDVLLNNLNNTIHGLNSMKTMNSYLFAKDKQLISSTTNNPEIISKIKDLLANEEKNMNAQIYTIDSQKIIINSSQLNDDIYKYLITTVSFDEIMEQYSKYFNQMIVFTILLFLFLLPLIWYFASVIVKPVLKLRKESEKVKNREYSQLNKINSRVHEIQELSDAMLDMAESIHEYQHNLELKVKERTKELKEKNEELERVSVTDKLTNIYNRLKLDEVILSQLTRAQRYNEKFGLMIIDVDYFKQVNDTYGHQVGDTTLVEISTILSNNVRKSDTVGRWGGEEFMIICPHTNHNGLEELANNLRTKIEKHKFPTINKKTASFGITIYKNQDDIETIIHRADEALYKAKENGRNRVESVI